jgi:LmbE family N-acetylglucosaminyl deacetylase
MARQNLQTISRPAPRPPASTSVRSGHVTETNDLEANDLDTNEGAGTMARPDISTSTTTDDIPTTAAAYAMVGNTLMALDRPLPRRLLGVWAHPDDEAYLSAGLMARVIAAGGQVTVLTATRGEKGTDDPGRYDSDAFGDQRELELRASLAVLGVTDVRLIGLRDGECDLADDETAVTAIETVVAEVRPDTIVTFGPDGMTNHADHKAVSRWTTEAWRRRQHGELLYATVTHDFAAAHRQLHERLGIFDEFDDRRPRSVGRSRVALECALRDAELDRKRAALAAHGSQTDGLAAAMGESTYRTWYRNERFRRPTRHEIAHCPLSTRFAPAPGGGRVLIGAAP